jgi:hypothetical protein
MREDVGCTGVTRLALWHHDIVAEEAKRFDFTGAVKWHCKNDLYMSTNSSHDAPYTSWEYGQAVSKMGHMIAVGVCKSSGLEGETRQWVRAARAIRARDKVTQRVATSWHIWSPV